MSRRTILNLTLAVVLAVASTVAWRIGSSPDAVAESGPVTAPLPVPTSAPATSPEQARFAADVSIRSLDGRQLFTVPRPGDPEWEDYLEMRAHPRFRSVLDGTDGYALPYDPEWRTVIDGRRPRSRIEFTLRDDRTSMEELARALLDALRLRDETALAGLRLDQEEFATLCWPEFPQSRPYVRIPADEVWGFHYASCLSGARQALREHGGRPLEFRRIRYDGAREYSNFALLQHVRIEAFDTQAQESVELSFCPTIIERDGRYKAYIYED